MTFTAKDIIDESTVLLQDVGGVRWTPPEILAYINGAVREICIRNPRASTELRHLSLDGGTRQTLPDDCLILSRVHCNVITDPLAPIGDPAPHFQSTAIRMVNSKEMLDAVLPNWMDSTSGATKQAAVLYVYYDPITPREFYVIPANNGLGKIEVVVGVLPARIPTPVSNPLDPASYTATVDLPDIYQSMVVDFVLYRALSKDSSLPGSKERALMHKQLFDTAMSAQAGAEYNASAAAAIAAAAATPR